MPDFITTKLKAYVGAAIAGLGTASTMLATACDEGQTAIGAVLAAVVAFGAIYGVPNKQA